MELWIRSQDKMKLKKTNGVYIILNSIYTNHEEIGTYKTEERALEVLAEIQDILNPKCILKSFDNITPEMNEKLIIKPCEVKIEELSTVVYQMPEE